MITPLSSLSLHFEYDLVAARRRARQIAALLGFEDRDQTRIATVASELARNALRYGGGGHVEFAVDRDGFAPSLLMTVTDRDPTARDAGDEAATRNGIAGARRLMDDLRVATTPGEGTTVTMRKALTTRAPDLTGEGVHRLMDELARQRSDSPLEEIQQQNAELLRALAELDEMAELLRRSGVQRPNEMDEKPLRILIVDDDETARYTLANYATRPGAEIFEAENGLHGIARAAADRPDVILLDLMMPGVGGHEVLARLKSDPATAKIPVVIVTSRFVNDDERCQILMRAANVVYKGDLSRETVSRAIAGALRAQ